MTTKEFLEQAYFLDREATMIIEKAEAMRSSIQYPRRKNKLSETVAKVVDYESEAEKKIASLVDVRIAIENAINTVSDYAQKEILERHYLLYQSFSEIAEKMGYSERQIHRLHAKALENVKI